MSYLMIIGIGPVQEFIASVRRSRDLWLGSGLLSKLTDAFGTVANHHWQSLTLLTLAETKG